MLSVILLAAGSGRRMQASVDDKILTDLGGTAAIIYSLQAFQESAIVNQYSIVYRDSAQKAAIETAIQQSGLTIGNPIHWVEGGSERFESVINALETQPPHCEHVFIHDAARPCITAESIRALHRAVLTDKAACLAHPVADTIKRIPKSGQIENIALEDLDRSRLWAMETPQAFHYPSILKAYQHVIAEALQITDDTAAAASIGLNTTLVPNPKPNPKLTTSSDIPYIEHLLRTP